MAFIGAAAAASGAGLFSYNRENYFFDRELQMKRDYQAQDMRIRQFELYREDVHDLVNLTVRKMDNYLIVNTLQLGFTITLFVEGRPEPDSLCPSWLTHLYTMCNVGAFLYYLLSIWLAMHASIAAHAFGVRLLTQFVRLPVPSDAQLDKSRGLAKEYESAGISDMLRIPLWKQQLKRLSETMGSSSSADVEDIGVSDVASDAGSDTGFDAAFSNTAAMLQHVRLYRQLQANWQSYDAYARVCMAMGTNALLHTLSYKTLGSLVGENNVPWPAMCCVLIFTMCAWVLAKLDLYLSRRILAVAGFLLITPPFFITCSLGFQKSELPIVFQLSYKVLVPAAFGLHTAWIIFMVRVAKAVPFGKVALPTNFRSVLYLDVFGWLAEEEVDEDDGTAEISDSDEPDVPHALSRVIEEDSEFQALPGDSLPPDVRISMVSTCRRLEASLRDDFRRWEAPDVRAMLREDSSSDRQMLRLRERFGAVQGQLTEELLQTPDQGAAAVSSSSSTRADDVSQADTSLDEVWLKLEWNSPDRTMSFFYHTESGRTLWETPQGPVRILSLQHMERQLGTLSEQAQALYRSNSPEAASHGNVELREEAAGSAGPEESRDRSVSGETSNGVTRGTRRNDSRAQMQPGQLPWLTVKQGSYVLIGAWVVSFLWSIVHVTLAKTKPPVGTKLSAVAAEPGTWMELPSAEMLRVHDWPKPLSRPVAVACHPGLGDVLLVAERYSVQAVSHGVALAMQVSSVQAALDACMASDVGFQSRGLRGLDLRCEEGSCSALLLGGDGTGLLHCPLENSGEHVAKLNLLGGPWADVALGASNEIWAIGHRLVKMRRRIGAENDFMPQWDVPETEVGEISGISSLLHLDGSQDGPGWLLGLRPEVQSVRAWSLQEADGPPPSSRWQLPGCPSGRWRSICASDSSLYMLDAGLPGSRTPSIWRSNLTESRVAK
ncbi:unnamed protein product [Polarella glacialis]|uniref:WW domain-containing protein n=1 Tax=Polarella glacialis TaxID=89957 RepID=A0A813G4S3_POLGL|nr:unnamed protein product [Polarella glacialis]